MKAMPINEASEEQLRQFALETLGIEIKPSAKIETVRARIQKAWNKPDILVADDAPEPALQQPAPKPAAATQQAPGKRMVRVILGMTEEAGGSDPVQVGVNGKVMLIPRDQECVIPEAYFEVLKHAVTYKYDTLKDGGMNPVPRKVPLYPYQVLKAA